MAVTRAARKRMGSRKRSYARRLRASPCRGKKAYACVTKPGCKMSKGKKRSFCRKSRNSRRMKGGNGTQRMWVPNSPLQRALVGGKEMKRRAMKMRAKRAGGVYGLMGGLAKHPPLSPSPLTAALGAS